MFLYIFQIPIELPVNRFTNEILNVIIILMKSFKDFDAVSISFKMCAHFLDFHKNFQFIHLNKKLYVFVNFSPHPSNHNKSKSKYSQ